MKENITSYKHLTEEEREQIHYLYYEESKSKEDIAKELGRDPSTIYREFSRNKTMKGMINNNNPEAKKDSKKWQYLPQKAQEKYLERRRESKQQFPFKTLELYEFVVEKIKLGWGPDLIAGRAKELGIGKTSHESIYKFVYYDPKAKEEELWKYLPRSRKKRRKRNGRKAKRTLIPNRVGIEMRPKAVEDRKEFGHWEDDSVVGVGKGAALNTKRERKSRYMMITKIPRKTARHTRLATCKRFKNLPVGAKKTNTMDNGCEFTEHEKTTRITGMNHYCANPYHSWERGTNENGNGLIRRFFPKKTDFNKITKKEIKAVEDWINHRPLKCLGYKTPHEVFHEELALCQKFFSSCT